MDVNKGRRRLGLGKSQRSHAFEIKLQFYHHRLIPIMVSHINILSLVLFSIRIVDECMLVAFLSSDGKPEYILNSNYSTRRQCPVKLRGFQPNRFW